MEKSNRVQIGILLGCLVVGLCIVGWLIANRGDSSGRRIVVDPGAKARPAPATRVAATRPFKNEFGDLIWKHATTRATTMLSADPKLATVEFAQGGYATPLHLAAFQGEIELAKMLIDAGAPLEAVEINHQGTPLEWAVFSGQAEMVKYLLSRGAKVTDECLMAAKAGAAHRGYLKEDTGRYREIQAILLADAKGAATRMAVGAATRAVAK